MTSDSLDWRAWHADYDKDSPLRRRLEIVQRQITGVLDGFVGSPLRVISMCAGEGRDILGALSRHRRRDVQGLLVELDPELAGRARRHVTELGLTDLRVEVGDAGRSRAYADAVPADLVLVCGVFGNISDADIERTVRALPELCAAGATVIWTRHRRPPNVTVSIKRWLDESGFEEVSFEPVLDSEASVGVARFLGEPAPLVDRQLFMFNRTTL
jgi:hypothetical protein